MSGECEICGMHIMDARCQCNELKKVESLPFRHHFTSVVEEFELNYYLGNAIKFILTCDTYEQILEEDMEADPIIRLFKAENYIKMEIQRRLNMIPDTE